MSLKITYIYLGRYVLYSKIYQKIYKKLYFFLLILIVKVPMYLKKLK